MNVILFKTPYKSSWKYVFFCVCMIFNQHIKIACLTPATTRSTGATSLVQYF